MSKKKTILMVSHCHPFPYKDGARMDVFFRIKFLKELGYDVILISFYNSLYIVPESSVLTTLCKEIYPIPYKRRSLRKFISLKPYTISTREVWKELDGIFKGINEKNVDIDAIIAESHYVVTVAERAKKRLKVPKLYLRSHNHESKFMKSVALSSGFFSLERFFFTVESIKYAMYIPILMRRLEKAAIHWHISLDECEDYKKKYPLYCHQFLPAGIDISKLALREPCLSKKVLFAGSLCSPNNRHGINWYLNNVHPLMISRDKDYHLLIAGDTREVSSKDIQKLVNHKRVTFYDTPDDMDSIYAEAQIFINPMLLGAGVKLKTIDAAIRGIPVVTTNTGNEGTGLTHGKDILVADSPEAFSSCLSQLLSDREKCKELSENAYWYLKENYNQKQSLKKLMTA